MVKRCSIGTMLILAMLVTPASLAREKLVVTYRPAADSKDYRFQYEYQLLKLALEKTGKKYGDFELVEGIGMNLPRTIYTARKNLQTNFFFKNSYSQEYLDELTYVPIPVDLGIVGYRVCFTSENILGKIAAIDSLEELRGLTIGQGKLWNDVEILRHNNFRVFEVLEYPNLFPMVAAGRFELYCRGANEVMKEWQEYKHISGLSLDQSFALAYKLPRFFWTNKQNTAALERITEGLTQAYDDGSLLELWEKFHLESVEFVRLDSRKIYWLENPQLKGITPDYEKYFYFRDSPGLGAPD